MQSDIVNTHLSDRQITTACKIHNAIRGIVYYKMGEGKSRIALGIYDLKHYKPPSILLIVCRRKAFDTWRAEILKVGFNCLIREFPKETGYSKIKPTVWLLSHAMLHKVYKVLNQYPIECIVHDELYLYSNPKSLLSRAASDLRNYFKNSLPIIGLSGTLMSKADNLAIYSQAASVGVHTRLAHSVTAFRDKYQRFFKVDFGYGDTRQYVNRPESFANIRRRLLPCCDFFFPKKSSREVSTTDIQVGLSPKQEQYIRQLKSEYYLEVEGLGIQMELRSTIELVHRVSQISNGYLPDGKGGIVTFPSPKLDAVINRVEEIVATGIRCVVWCYYPDDIERIKMEATFKTLQMSGRHEFDSKLWATGKIPVVLATVGTGASINDFSQVQHAVYFSHSYKLLDLEQSRARTDRKDSEHTTAYYNHYLSKGTFDSEIIKAARDSEMTQNKFIKLCRNTFQSM